MGFFSGFDLILNGELVLRYTHSKYFDIFIWKIPEYAEVFLRLNNVEERVKVEEEHILIHDAMDMLLRLRQVFSWK